MKALSQRSLEKIKLHYTEEYHKTLSKLKELETVLLELGDVTVTHSDVLGEATESTPQQVESPHTESVEQQKQPSEDKPEKRSYKKRAKKRGRKSVWGEFVIKRLKSTQKPLSYDDLANHAIVIMKLDTNEFDKVRKSIIGAVFNLRTNQDKLATVSKNGTRDKYVLLKSWVDEKNKMLPEFKDKL